MRILFVCMGNICRSPSAENVMRAVAGRENIGPDLLEKIDSAGTISLHTGNPPDSRMTEAANRRGIEMKGAARQVKPSDFAEFDLILAMDDDNLADLESWPKPDNPIAKIALFCDFCENHPDFTEVPDPYYGGVEGFETVMDLLEDGCSEIAQRIKDRTVLA